MSIHRWGAKRDANEPALCEALEAAGARIWKLSGRHLPDLLVLYRGRWMPLAVKAPKGTLTSDERQGVPWPLVRTVEEALQAILAPERSSFKPGGTPSCVLRVDG